MYVHMYVHIHIIVLTEVDSGLLTNPIVFIPVTVTLNRVSSGSPVKL